MVHLITFIFVTAPKGHVVVLDFRDYFDIEKSKDCKNDFLEVRDGPHGYNDLLYGAFCGTDFPPEITSTDRYLWIQFKSDENIEAKGFRAVFRYQERDASGNFFANYSNFISFLYLTPFQLRRPS